MMVTRGSPSERGLTVIIIPALCTPTSNLMGLSEEAEVWSPAIFQIITLHNRDVIVSNSGPQKTRWSTANIQLRATVTLHVLDDSIYTPEEENPAWTCAETSRFPPQQKGGNRFRVRAQAQTQPQSLMWTLKKSSPQRCNRVRVNIQKSQVESKYIDISASQKYIIVFGLYFLSCMV